MGNGELPGCCGNRERVIPIFAMQVYFHLQRHHPHLQTYPPPTSTSSSPCSFHSKHPEIFIQNLACNPSVHSVAYRGWTSHLLIRTICRRFHICLVSLKDRTFTVYADRSCWYGHWPTATPTLSDSSLLALYVAVLRIGYSTRDDQTLDL